MQKQPMQLQPCHQQFDILTSQEQQLDWLASVEYYKNYFLQSPLKSWLLYEQDALRFSILFFALLSANKKIVMPQNGCINQLRETLKQAQGYAGSENLSANAVVRCDLKNHAIPNANTLSIASDTEVIFFTSGSTGKAKAIVKQFIHLITEVDELEATFGKRVSGCCFVSTVSHQHIYGLLVKLLWPLWTGKQVILNEFEYPEHVNHAIAQFDIAKVTLISSPAHFNRLVKDNVYIQNRHLLKNMFSSGGPLASDTATILVEQLMQAPIEILGSTETGGIAWRQRNKLNDEQWQAFTGLAIAQCEKTQCLKIRSPYLPNADWYQTDDRVSLSDGNSFQLLGRVDRIVKIEEKRVSLDQVQQVLKLSALVEDAYCLVVRKRRGDQVAAIVELTEKAKSDYKNARKLELNRAIQANLKADLEAIAIPKRFRYVDCLPYNSSGKLSKVEMEKLFD